MVSKHHLWEFTITHGNTLSNNSLNSLTPIDGPHPYNIFPQLGLHLTTLMLPHL